MSTMVLRNRRVRLWVLAASVAVMAVLVFFRLQSIPHSEDGLPVLGSRDLLAYWSAARLLRAEADPYDPEALLAVQQAAGWRYSQPQLIWNPPWALALLVPLACLPLGAAAVVWFALQTAMICGSGLVLWGYFAAPDRRYWIGLLVAAAFVPGLLSLRIGQLAGWLMVGAAGFLWAERHRHDWLAGACLAILCIKPHVALVFLAVVLWWAWRQRRPGVLGGWLAALAGATGVACAFAPNVVAGFIGAASRPPLRWFTPTWGAWLRSLAPECPWMQFVPLFLGLVCALGWITRRARPWDWQQIGPPLLLLSSISAPYGWSFDQAILLPTAVALVSQVRSTTIARRLAVLGGLAAAEVGLVAVNQAQIGDQYTVWHPAALAVLWWFGRSGKIAAVLPEALDGSERRMAGMGQKSVQSKNTIIVDNLSRGRPVALHGRVADGLWSRFRGLMGAKPLAVGGALLIVPCRSIHTHFMRFPIDVLYVNGDLQVVGIDEHLKPWRLGKNHRGTQFVVELPPGTARASETQVGDQLRVVGYRKWPAEGR